MLKAFVFLALFLSIAHADDGELLFQGNCVTCHYPNKSISAPSIQKVRAIYKSAFQDKKDFIYYMSEWVLHPSYDTAMMSDAVTKYKLMPQLAYEKEVLEEIAAYIYENDFAKHKNNTLP